MEMPISIMIVLFVSIAVAILVLQFTGQVIGTGTAQMQRFTLNCEENVDFFIETAILSPTQVAELVDACYNQNIGKYNGTKICYIVHGPVEGDPVSAAKTEQLGETDTTDAGKTIYIKFNEITQLVDVTG